MNLIDQHLDRAHEIIGERTPREEKYDNEVLLWLEKTGKIRKAINKANKCKVRCRVLVSALADICLRRYIKKTCQEYGELSLKIEEQGGLHP